LKRIVLSSILLCSIAATSLRAQSVKDSSFFFPLVGMHVAGQLPQADLAKRFGANFSAGGSFLLKTKKNFLFGVEGSYFFGRNVKEDVLTQLRNTEGFVTDNQGFPADLRVTERGWNLYAVVGKIFPKFGHNPNSGITAWIGGGYMQHKIKLYDAQKKVAAVKGDLAKGYDRLSGGPALTQFIGYTYLSNNRLVNFYAGFEFFEGFTKSYRVYNYDTGLRDTKNRFDMQIGFRFGWLLPLYKKTPREYYYN